MLPYFCSMEAFFPTHWLAVTIWQPTPVFLHATLAWSANGRNSHSLSVQMGRPKSVMQDAWLQLSREAATYAQAGGYAHHQTSASSHGIFGILTAIRSIASSHLQNRKSSCYRSRLPGRAVLDVHLCRQLLSGFSPHQERCLIERPRHASVPKGQEVAAHNTAFAQRLLLVLIAEALLRPTVPALPAANVQFFWRPLGLRTAHRGGATDCHECTDPCPHWRRHHQRRSGALYGHMASSHRTRC